MKCKHTVCLIKCYQTCNSLEIITHVIVLKSKKYVFVSWTDHRSAFVPQENSSMVELHLKGKLSLENALKMLPSVVNV